MTDRPIIFSAPMVRALLEGRKTQTRRVIKPQPHEHPSGRWMAEIRFTKGDRLWVREAFITGFDLDEDDRPTGDRKVWYRATDGGLRWYDPDADHFLDVAPWRPSIHMPRWASRLTLTVTDVRVQRLQDISRGDAMADGCPFANMADGPDPRKWFADLWKDLHQPIIRRAPGSSKANPAAWDANPWVCALTFTVEQRNIDAGDGND